LEMFGMRAQMSTAAALWKHLLQWLEAGGENSLAPYRDAFSLILDKGTLSKRLLRTLGSQPSSDALLATYQQLGVCLAENKMYDA